jgi:hypothetical protein
LNHESGRRSKSIRKRTSPDRQDTTDEHNKGHKRLYYQPWPQLEEEALKGGESTIVVLMMSSSGAEGTATEVEAEKEVEVCCANCGIAQVDDIKLKICGDCQSVSYCSDICRENHREQHEEECKKRKAEIHDKELFEQPEETCFGECPLCFLPMPLDHEKSIFYSCCCRLVCKGCEIANLISGGGGRCPFCREPAVKGNGENDKRVMERVKVNDPNALSKMGLRRIQEGDYETSIEYYTKAAELGAPIAHFQLGCLYYSAEGVEKDEEKGIYHWERAAIGGHHSARHNLACVEEKNGNIERAVKHLIIAANLGCEDSMKDLWQHFSAGNITKEELESTLRTHKAAIDATKSDQRDAAETYYQQLAASRR